MIPPEQHHAHRTMPPQVKSGIDRPPSVRTMTVVEVMFPRGEGCCEEDPVRLVYAYYGMDGELLAERDAR